MKKEEKRKKKRFSSHGGEAGKRRVKCEERNCHSQEKKRQNKN